MGNDAAVENRGIIPDIGRYTMNMANAGHGSGDRGKFISRQKRKQKPKVWESFERLYEWQYQEVNNAQVESENLMSMITGAADAVMKNIWGNGEEHSEGGFTKDTKRKSPSGKSRSR
jgi:hypothetical protein